MLHSWKDPSADISIQQPYTSHTLFISWAATRTDMSVLSHNPPPKFQRSAAFGHVW